MYTDPTSLSLGSYKTTDVLIFMHRLNIHLNRNKHSKTLPWKCAWDILHKLISQLRRFLCCVWQRWLSLHLLFFRNYKWTILQVVHLTPNWSHENSFNYGYCFRSIKHCSVDYLTSLNHFCSKKLCISATVFVYADDLGVHFHGLG